MSFMAETATIAIKTLRSSAVRRTFTGCSLFSLITVKVAARPISCAHYAPENPGFSQEGFERLPCKGHNQANEERFNG